MHGVQYRKRVGTSFGVLPPHNEFSLSQIHPHTTLMHTHRIYTPYTHPHITHHKCRAGIVVVGYGAS